MYKITAPSPPHSASPVDRLPEFRRVSPDIHVRQHVSRRRVNVVAPRPETKAQQYLLAHKHPRHVRVEREIGQEVGVSEEEPRAHERSGAVSHVVVFCLFVGVGSCWCTQRRRKTGGDREGMRIRLGEKVDGGSVGDFVFYTGLRDRVKDSRRAATCGSFMSVSHTGGVTTERNKGNQHLPDRVPCLPLSFRPFHPPPKYLVAHVSLFWTVKGS